MYSMRSIKAKEKMQEKLCMKKSMQSNIYSIIKEQVYMAHPHFLSFCSALPPLVGQALMNEWELDANSPLKYLEEYFEGAGGWEPFLQRREWVGEMKTGIAFTLSFWMRAWCQLPLKISRRVFWGGWGVRAFPPKEGVSGWEHKLKSIFFPYTLLYDIHYF